MPELRQLAIGDTVDLSPVGGLNSSTTSVTGRRVAWAHDCLAGDHYLPVCDELAKVDRGVRLADDLPGHMPGQVLVESSLR